jgi:hypothetical protein
MQSKKRLSINLTDRDVRVLSGIGFGNADRQKFKLEEADKKGLKVYVFVDPKILSINSSYFLSLFGESIRTLGEGLFRDRYIFDCSTVIRERCIEPGIKEALKT